MSIFVYTENISGAYKKAALEAVSYAKTVADMSGTDVVAVSINPTDVQMFFTNTELLKWLL